VGSTPETQPTREPTPAPRPAASGGTPASTTGRAALRGSVRGMGYREGAAALSPRGPAGGARVTASLRQVTGGGAGAPGPAAPGTASTAAPRAGDDIPTHTRPMEVLTGSDQTRSTRGEYTDRILQMMQQQPGLRFVDAARRVSMGNLTADRPGRSARLSPEDPLADGPSTRYALVLAASDYQPGEADLPEIAQQTAPGGSLRGALEGDYGRGHVQVAHDPTADRMREAIGQAIDRVASQVPPGGRGELMVTFQGHGDRSGFEGVDRWTLTPPELMQLAVRAQRARVELTVVSDACYQGTVALAGAAMAHHTLGARLDAAGLPPAEAARLRAELDGVREVFRMLRRINPLVEDLARHAEGGHGSVPWTRARATFLEFRDWLRIYGGPIQTGYTVLSLEANRRLRAMWEQVVRGPEPPDAQGPASRAFADRTREVAGRALDRLNEEIASVQEGIDLAISLGGIR
jgi:hypothetical protein